MRTAGGSLICPNRISTYEGLALAAWWLHVLMHTHEGRLTYGDVGIFRDRENVAAFTELDLFARNSRKQPLKQRFHGKCHYYHRIDSYPGEFSKKLVSNECVFGWVCHFGLLFVVETFQYVRNASFLGKTESRKIGKVPSSICGQNS